MYARTFVSLVIFDARAVSREGVLVYTLVLVLLATVAARVLGQFEPALGIARFHPVIAIAVLISIVVAFAMICGLLLVDETDSGVREALAVVPARPGLLLLCRTALALVCTVVLSLAGIAIMGLVALPLAAWLAVVAVLAPAVPVAGLVIPAVAGNKVEALALFKGASLILLAPLATFFLPDAGYRLAFLVSPTGWAVEAYRAFLEGSPTGYLWSAGGVLYASALMAAAAVHYHRTVYRLRR